MSTDKQAAEATPRPWGSKGPTIYDANDEPIVCIAATNTTTAEDDEIAAMIVRAVNAHDALVEALNAVITDPQDEHEAFDEGEGFIIALHLPYGDLLRARAALRLAEEGSEA